MLVVLNDLLRGRKEPVEYTVIRELAMPTPFTTNYNIQEIVNIGSSL